MSPRKNNSAPTTDPGDAPADRPAARAGGVPGRTDGETGAAAEAGADVLATGLAEGGADGGAGAVDDTAARVEAAAANSEATPLADTATAGETAVHAEVAAAGGAPARAETPAHGRTGTRAAAEADGAAATDGDVTLLPETAADSDTAARVEAATGSRAAPPAEAETTSSTEAEPDRDAAGGGQAPGADERIVAVRRVAAAGRRWRVAQLAGCAALLALAFTGGSIALGAARDGGTAAVAAAPSGLSPELLASGSLDASISSLQAHLRAQPQDFGSWATLGLAYVEQARTKGDPARYPQAQRALDRSLKLRPDNDAALAGRAALAAARHRFAEALKYADEEVAQNPYNERALSSRIDALVELGRYDEASKAADEADSRRPGVPVFTRYAYVHELRGDVKTAQRVLKQALSTATSRGDVAYVASALGQLAWNQGEYGSALTYYARALAADDAYLPALEGRARAQAAQGDRAGAIRAMENVVARFPLPQPLVELGELYEARGDKGDARKAREQYALVDAWIALARANGVNADLDTALAAADHGDRKAALTAARAEWARRHTLHTADALAWALHVNGRDAEALPYARRATATGYRNAAFLYHRGMIERATGHRKDARDSLKAALRLNPGFSPLGAREARKALEAAE